MADNDRILRQKLREESDEMLFSNMEMSEKLKQRIRQQTAEQKNGSRFFIPKTWIVGAVSLAAAIMIIAGLPMLQQSAVPAPTENPGGSVPSNEGAIGSELTSLITTPLGSAEEVKSAFGPELLVPQVVPEGYTISEMVVVGMDGEPPRDAIFTYVSSDDKSYTFVASRLQAAFPVELFAPTKVDGLDGFVFEQPELTELYWEQGGIQYGITGPFSADEAMKVAESVEP